MLMGNKNLWRIHQRREELYSKTDLTESETDEIGDIEEEFDKAGGYTMEADAAKMLQGLGISEDQHFETMSSLTGGFKFRVLLAQCLFADPDVLLMDEPTNNLDMASIDWLINFLKRTQATVVVISHDRHFLNSVCTDIADLDYGEVRMFVGNYDDFIIANDIAMDQIRKDNAKKEKRVEELQGFIQRFGANASKAKQATARRKELEKIDIQKFKPSSRVSPFIRFESLEKLGEKVFDLDNVSKTYDDADGQVFSPVQQSGVIFV